MPRRCEISLYLRRRAGALLLAAARVSGRAAGQLFSRRHSPRISYGKRMRAQLHGFVRASGCGSGFMACAAAFGADSDLGVDSDRVDSFTADVDQKLYLSVPRG